MDGVGHKNSKSKARMLIIVLEDLSREKLDLSPLMKNSFLANPTERSEQRDWF